MAEGDKTRGAALALVEGVLAERRQISEMTGPGGPLESLEPGERARAQRLALQTLRHGGRADEVLKPMLRKHPPEKVRMILRLAIVEMLEEGAAPHGVVNSAVTLMRRDPATRPTAGMANAVLRKAAEMPPEDWAALAPQRMPGWLRGRLESLHGRAGVLALEAAQAAPVPLDLTPKDGDCAGLAARVGGACLPTGSVRLGAGQVTALPGYETGAWWVQDAAAAIPARLLDAQPGERVADLCAAPGGKTMQLAATGAQVVALDSSEARLERLHENLARTDLSAEVVTADLLEWQPEAPFDAILLDAPCSATGTIRRHPDLPFVRNGKDIKPLFELQARMIDKALALLKPGGRMVYCTCSLLPEEGEQQLAHALERHEGLEVIRPEAAWIEPGWHAPGGGLRLSPAFWPERGGMDGFFIAVLRKG